MKLSKLIEKLNEVLADSGDLEVMIPSDVDAEYAESDTADAEGVATILDENDRPAFVMICDGNTLDALSS